MSRSQDVAYRLRWLILVTGLLCLGAGLFWVLDFIWPQIEFSWLEPEGPMGLFYVLGWPFQDDSEFGWVTYGFVFVYVGVFFVTQWLFLAPLGGWRIPLSATGRPLRRSVLSAALMAGLLTTGLIAVVLELPNVWIRLTVGMSPNGEVDDAEVLRIGSLAVATLWPALWLLAASWALWAWVFAVYWRQGDRYTQMGRMIRGLIAGSLLELMVSIPAHVWVMRQRECYCFRGTYTGIVLATTVLLWAFGPGIVLLFLRERYRREKLTPLCWKCGYDLHATTDRESCPECGAKINRNA